LGGVLAAKQFLIACTYMCMHMVRQVSLSEEAYDRLKKVKKNSESFSDVVLRIVKSPTGDLNRFFGAWKEEDYARVESKIFADRKRSHSRDVRFK
jgi:predicted CopG family antitoxin